MSRWRRCPRTGGAGDGEAAPVAARLYTRVLRVGRTIADLAGATVVQRVARCRGAGVPSSHAGAKMVRRNHAGLSSPTERHLQFAGRCLRHRPPSDQTASRASPNRDVPPARSQLPPAIALAGGRQAPSPHRQAWSCLHLNDRQHVPLAAMMSISPASVRKRRSSTRHPSNNSARHAAASAARPRACASFPLRQRIGIAR